MSAWCHVLFPTTRTGIFFRVNVNSARLCTSHRRVTAVGRGGTYTCAHQCITHTHTRRRQGTEQRDGGGRMRSIRFFLLFTAVEQYNTVEKEGKNASFSTFVAQIQTHTRARIYTYTTRTHRQYTGILLSRLMFDTRR